MSGRFYGFILWSYCFASFVGVNGFVSRNNGCYNQINPMIQFDCTLNNTANINCSLNITVVSSATQNILEYSNLSFAINDIYSKIRGYNFRKFISDMDCRDIGDPKWSRVSILDELMTDQNENNYFVWIDADLIFLDMSFRLESVIKQYTDADIIISSEFHAETGVANTGSIIFRSSEWSRRFLREWWQGDHSSHDQFAFDVLYKSMLQTDPSVVDHIVILPTTALNTMPPAYLGDVGGAPRFDRVLHLMGESNSLRVEVFRFALDSLCESLRDASAAQTEGSSSLIDLGVYVESRNPRLGLTSQRLTTITRTVHNTRIEQLLRDVTVYEDHSLCVSHAASTRCHKSWTHEAISLFVVQASELRQLLLLKSAMDRNGADSISFAGGDVSSLVASLDSGSVLSALHTATKAVLNQHSEATNNCETGSGKPLHCASDIISLANTCATLGNDWLQQATLSPSRRAALHREVEAHLGLLELFVSHASLDTVRSMQAMLSGNEGHWLEREGRVVEAVEAHRRSLTTLDQIADINPYLRIDPLRSVARAVCALGARESSVEGLALFAEAVALQMSLLRAEGQVAQDHFRLAGTLAEAALCDQQISRGKSPGGDYVLQLQTLCGRFSRGATGVEFGRHCSQLSVTLTETVPQIDLPDTLIESEVITLSSARQVKKMRRKKANTYRL